MDEKAKVVELPPSPEKRRRKIMLIGGAAIVVLSLVVVLVLSFSPVLAAKKIEVTGTKLLSEKQLLESLAPLEGTPLPRISEAKVEELLGEQPAIDSIVVRAQMPDTLVVEIHEEVPVAILVDGKTNYLVSDTGGKLKKLGAKDKTKLPKIKASDATKDPEQFKLLTSILSGVDAKVLEQVSTASLTEAGFMELALPQKRTLIWGNGDNAALKNQVTQIFLNNSKDSAEAKKTIDVSNPENPVTY
ncbi:cell division protein FtsQ/DivIB [Glutamicibacter protophormiae]|uniref:cell division protein FtsQ/DivIB n=1 Tax=Glutamicibacter protophormiae TaxID=37930 RepID=UPI00195F23DC|nr:FtsQ-type POTRA domain-containing protein [Glutamicibacter protophormiae]QRQ77434.1 FtsQ-type POTRA domain-containing protein [Glutamicibacter protophormiae]